MQLMASGDLTTVMRADTLTPPASQPRGRRARVPVDTPGPAPRASHATVTAQAAGVEFQLNSEVDQVPDQVRVKLKVVICSVNPLTSLVRHGGPLMHCFRVFFGPFYFAF
jgi:hypothetical protein